MESETQKRNPRSTALRPVRSTELLKEFGHQVANFSELCAAPPSTMSRSWWVIGLARVLAERKFAVRTEPEPWLAYSHLLGPKGAVPDADQLKGIDAIAWSSWSSHAYGDESYGSDERELPPIYIVRLVLDHIPDLRKPKFSDLWNDFAALSRAIRGPLTASLVVVNRIPSGPRAWNVAQQFDAQMNSLKVDCEVTTHLINMPGGGGFFLNEELDEFQLLLGSKTWNRKFLKNPGYEPRQFGRRMVRRRANRN